MFLENYVFNFGFPKTATTSMAELLKLYGFHAASDFWGIIKTENMGGDILKTIESYKGLPFTTRWLTRIHGIGKTRFGLKELINAGIIKGYPALPDVKPGLVSQAEHSVLVFDKPIIITKLD